MQVVELSFDAHVSGWLRYALFAGAQLVPNKQGKLHHTGRNKTLTSVQYLLKLYSFSTSCAHFYGAFSSAQFKDVCERNIISFS